jgi:hypothetical protein
MPAEGVPQVVDLATKIVRIRAAERSCMRYVAILPQQMCRWQVDGWAAHVYRFTYAARREEPCPRHGLPTMQQVVCQCGE